MYDENSKRYFVGIVVLFLAVIVVYTLYQERVFTEKQLVQTMKTTQIPGTQSEVFNSNMPAPELTGITAWLNPSTPLTLQHLRGKVVLIDFWTNQCINCIHTLPYVTKWYDTYKEQGFIVIGVHTPELAYEHTLESIKTAIQTYKIHYPVAQDNNYTTWNAYNNQYWPAEYLIDKKGIIRRTYFGEGEYDQTEQAIRTLLKEPA